MNFIAKNGFIVHSVHMKKILIIANVFTCVVVMYMYRDHEQLGPSTALLPAQEGRSNQMRFRSPQAQPHQSSALKKNKTEK